MSNDYLKTLKIFKKKLTNLGGKNKSLVQLRLSKQQDLDLDDLDYLLGNSSFTILSELLSKKRSVSLCKELDARNEKTNTASRRLKQISRKDNFIFEENGSRDLYLAWPYVEGKFAENSIVRAPLLFFPVRIFIEKKEWRLALRKEIAVSFNKTFLLAFGKFNQININEELLEYSFDGFKSDIDLFRRELYDLLKASPLEINFNQELFRDRLERFVDYKKVDYEHGQQGGVLKLVPNAVIGIFSQAGSYLLPDYEELIERNNYDSIESLFESKSYVDNSKVPLGFGFINKIKEEKTVAPLEIDASQENALKALKSGHSIVVQGPPGTGKSQLICNVIADYLSRGKKVLVVCQKRAALDVVYKRMDDLEICSFVGLIHDHKEDRAKLYGQIHKQIDSLKEYESINTNYDSIQVDRDFLKYSRKIDTLLESFDEFKSALFDDKEYGRSVKDIYLTCSKDCAKLDLTQQYRSFNNEQEHIFCQTLVKIEKFETKYNFNHPWFERVSFARFTLEDYSVIQDHLDCIYTTIADFENESTYLLGSDTHFDDAFWVLDKKENLLDMFLILENDTLFKNYQKLLNTKPDKDWLLLQEAQINDYFREKGIELSTPTEHLGGVIQIIEKAMDARKNIFKRIKWVLVSKDKFVIKRLLQTNDLDWSKKGFKRLTQLLDNRLNLEHKLSVFKDKEWLIGAPMANKVSIENWFHNHFLTIQAIEDSQSIASKIDLLGFKNLDRSVCLQKVNSLIKISEKFKEQYENWLTHFTPLQIQTIYDEPETTSLLKSELENHFENLVLFDKIILNLSEDQKEVLRKLQDKKIKPHQFTKVFKNSNQFAWINHIEKKHPILKLVSTEGLTFKEEELKEAIEQKKKLSLKILQANLREQTFNNIEYNRLKNRVSYRALDHQVTKKRSLYPVRKLLSEFTEEIFQLIPCWLASPESVSSILPMQRDFDLVIFDEASQCYAEKALPSFERSNQIMITGDDQQLSPKDLYQVRFEEDDEELLETQKDSLLDLAAQYLPSVMLMGHYRSDRPELIAFSNHHFYNDKLQVIPSPEDHRSAIQYHYLSNGLWQNNTNTIEAKKVVEEVFSLMDSGEENIGVVTFNYKQQQLIQDLIEEHARINKYALPEHLFIKNIENVQGDERDHIIFSIAYAKNIAGKQSAHFGTLNQEFGERRLNVAISRAKKSIQIITSLLPHELQVEHTKHIGPKLLQAYLSYAFTCAKENSTKRLKTNDSNRLQLVDLIKQLFPENIKVQTVDFADLKHSSSQRKALLLTDDALYYSFISSKEAHYSHQEKLKKRGWIVDKQFSRNYWFNKEQIKSYIESNS